jgi:hypothetical protein
MIRLRTFALLVLAGLIVVPAGQSSAQVKYVDENGNSHWVQSESQVPERYQGKATKPNLPTILHSDGMAERALDKQLQRLRKDAANDKATTRAKCRAGVDAMYAKRGPGSKISRFDIRLELGPACEQDFLDESNEYVEYIETCGARMQDGLKHLSESDRVSEATLRAAAGPGCEKFVDLLRSRLRSGR